MRFPLHSYNVQILVCNFELQIHIQMLYAGTARWIAQIIIEANSRNYLYNEIEQTTSLAVIAIQRKLTECLQHRAYTRIRHGDNDKYIKQV